MWEQGQAEGEPNPMVHRLALASGVEVEQVDGEVLITLPTLVPGAGVTSAEAWALAVDLLAARELLRRPDVDVHRLVVDVASVLALGLSVEAEYEPEVLAAEVPAVPGVKLAKARTGLGYPPYMADRVKLICDALAVAFPGSGSEAWSEHVSAGRTRLYLRQQMAGAEVNGHRRVVGTWPDHLVGFVLAGLQSSLCLPDSQVICWDRGTVGRHLILEQAEQRHAGPLTSSQPTPSTDPLPDCPAWCVEHQPPPAGMPGSGDHYGRTWPSGVQVTGHGTDLVEVDVPDTTCYGRAELDQLVADLVAAGAVAFPSQT